MTLELLLIALAGWRLAALLVLDDGPFGLSRRVRSAVWRDGHPILFLGELLQCMACATFWTALACWGVAEWRIELLIPLAGWGLATLAERATS